MLLVWQNIELFLSSSQMLSWDVGKINPQKLPSLKGTMSLQAGASKPDENPTINIQFKIQQMAISGTRTRFSLLAQEHCGHQVVPNALKIYFSLMLFHYVFSVNAVLNRPEGEPTGHVR